MPLAGTDYLVGASRVAGDPQRLLKLTPSFWLQCFLMRQPLSKVLGHCMSLFLSEVVNVTSPLRSLASTFVSLKLAKMHGLRKMQISKRDAAQTEAHACQCVGQNAWVFLWDRECSASQVQIQPVKWHFMQHCHSLTCTPFYSDDWVLLPFNRHVSSKTHTH